MTALTVWCLRDVMAALRNDKLSIIILSAVDGRLLRIACEISAPSYTLHDQIKTFFHSPHKTSLSL